MYVGCVNLPKLLCVFVIHRQTSITPSLKNVSHLFAGKIDHLNLNGFLINVACEIEVLINLLTSPCSSLRKLNFYNCTFSSGVYNCLITAIATSKLTHFTADLIDIDITRAKAIAKLLVDSKTLEEVVLIEPIERPSINKDVAVILAEAMNNSSVKNLIIGHLSKDTVLDCHYPTERVSIIMSLE